MKIHLIAIGNELLNGKITDKNAHTLARVCQQEGIMLERVHLIGDKKELYEDALNTASISADVVILSGGLGPTADDLTKEILASYYQKKLEFSDKALELTQKQYAEKKREYDQTKLSYQIMPKSFLPIYNKVGFAPGLFYIDQKTKTAVYALPGVPAEFKQMLTDFVIPRSKELYPQKMHHEHFIVRTWGIPEAKIFKSIDTNLWSQLSAFGEVSSLPHQWSVDIGIHLVDSNQDSIKEKKKELTGIFQDSPISEHIWQIGDLSLEQYIFDLAKKKKLKIGFAESCTSGLNASRITDIPGSSAVMMGSLVSYSNEAKIEVLGVKENTLRKYGAVSEQCAIEMAKGAQKRLQCDIAISTTGIKGPGGGSVEKPVGTVWVGVATSQKTVAKTYHVPSDRLMCKRKFSEIALFTLLEEIKKA